jgi:hypothetical protein
LMKYSVSRAAQNATAKIFDIVKRQIIRTSVRFPAREIENGC